MLATNPAFIINIDNEIDKCQQVVKATFTAVAAN